MDGLRWQLLDNYNSLTQKLNRNIKKYDVFEDEITIRPESIQREMDNIREALVFLDYCFDEREGGLRFWIVLTLNHLMKLKKWKNNLKQFLQKNV